MYWDLGRAYYPSSLQVSLILLLTWFVAVLSYLVLWIPTEPRIFFLLSSLASSLAYLLVTLMVISLSSLFTVGFFVSLFDGYFVGFFVCCRFFCLFILRLFCWLLRLRSTSLLVYSALILLASLFAVSFFVGLFNGYFVGFFVCRQLLCWFIRRLFRWILSSLRRRLTCRSLWRLFCWLC